MTGHEIRQKFLDYFAERGHRVVRSSSLVPANDPTLLFTNAGMNQFKDVFLGLEKRDYSRAATAQKCVRAGGKHNDLDNVGYTRRHHTFFEMMGNFSFGDYFKKDAIAFGWELVTRDYGIPADRLYVTVFREDEEAEQLWQHVAGVPKDRIFRLDEKDNFWQMGETGPCGPCSEIHYDLGRQAAAPGREHEEFPSDAGGRFVEIWNLVFMQYDRSAEGVLTPLPRPSIDTGLGLERVSAILQGKLSNYECDLLADVVQRAAALLGRPAVTDFESSETAYLRIAADHARATAFLITDGVVPSNEGRGYVLRKIMRRALRNARSKTGIDRPWFHQLVEFVCDFMAGPYPELIDAKQRVSRVVRDEEQRYATTFQVAERVFLEEARSAKGEVLPGAVAFKLYDTYGLALDELDDMAREFGLRVDKEGFEIEMQAQRERARASWKGAEKAQIAPVYHDLLREGRTEFLGYEGTACAESTVRALIVEQQAIQEIPAGMRAELVLDRTPFYAESGGQVGDKGALYRGTEKVAEVEGTYSAVPGLTVHRITSHAVLRADDVVLARVEDELRRATMRNHTATHLLHAALRSVLGTHVKQAGSVVEPARLRFDFTHYAPVSREQLLEIEDLINREILRNIPVSTEVMDIEKALATGAMALFGEKYGERVRVVRVPGFSTELCGGTHVSRTGDIGACVITSESGIAAGVRRVEAITGTAVIERLREISRDYTEKLESAGEQQRALSRQLEDLKAKYAQAQVGNVESQAREVKGVKVLSIAVQGLDRAQLRNLADALRNKWKSGIVVLATTEDSKVAIISAVTKDLIQKVHAGKLAGSVAQAVGGKGGGRPDMAEAGGSNPAALASALENVYATVEGML
ncbi:MAG TPA: alanine--tRNA ligase [Bryobacteraceae bacterium]|nr:alanine--tRNA ligase [Bryobacteraceae bacterium]